MKDMQVFPGGALDSQPVLGRWTPAAQIGAGILALVLAYYLCPSTIHPTLPYSDVSASAALFWCCVGLMLTGHGLESARAAKKALKARAQYPGENWRWEFEPRLDIYADKTHSMAWVLVGCIVIVISGVPIWVSFQRMPDSEFRVLLLGIYLFIGAALAAYFAYGAFFLRKYGIARLRLPAFPIFLGDQMDVRLTTSRPFGAFESMRVNLICLQEEWTPEPCIENFGSARRREIVVTELYRDTLRLTPNTQYDPDRPLEIAILLPLPDQRMGTRLNCDKPRYWVLEVYTEAPGLDFKARFRLPIYSRIETIPQKRP